ncbi:hypothetical protein AHiyo4_50560 [Arthrobacter sp. Hiyo4]|nr:hypothetical protein AHiyo4_50560 [Arthrobacter sp. Hiyo4]
MVKVYTPEWPTDARPQPVKVYPSRTKEPVCCTILPSASGCQISRMASGMVSPAPSYTVPWRRMEPGDPGARSSLSFAYGRA